MWLRQTDFFCIKKMSVQSENNINQYIYNFFYCSARLNEHSLPPYTTTTTVIGSKEQNACFFLWKVRSTLDPVMSRTKHDRYKLMFSTERENQWDQNEV